MNRAVSHLREIEDAVSEKAKEVGRIAEARLAAHRKTGNASVTVTRSGVDSIVHLNDPAALSIEFGHMVKGKYETDTPKYVPGLYIITGAAGLTR